MPDTASPLPRDVDIPVLPSVGITWYHRSGNYRRRRVVRAERQARLRMAERLRERGYGTLAG